MNRKETEELILKYVPEETYFDLMLIERFSDKLHNPNFWLCYLYTILDTPFKRNAYFQFRKYFGW